MSSEPTLDGPTSKDPLPRGQRVLGEAASAIHKLSELLGDDFRAAARALLDCRGMVVVTGMGKAGLIGSKVSATLASTGTRSFFLHPAEAVHGDLGRIYHEDVVIVLSRSGTTQEVLRLIEPLKRLGVRLVAITSHPESALGRHADVCLDIGPVIEACPLGLAPTTSTSVMLALGDALAISVMELREFSKEDFARFHPAGALGRRLLTVREVMRKSPSVSAGSSLRTAIAHMTTTRAGCVSVVDPAGRLLGFFTDGDSRRHHLAAPRPIDLDARTVDEFMTRSPRTIGPEHLASEAVHLMKERQIDQIPVVDDDGNVVGLLDVQDLMAVGLV